MNQTAPYRTDIPVWTLGDRLRRAREYGGFTQQRLADKLEVGLRAIKEGEADKNAPRHWLLVAWAFACGVHPDWLEHGTMPDDSGIRPGDVAAISEYLWREHPRLFDLDRYLVAS